MLGVQKTGLLIVYLCVCACVCVLLRSVVNAEAEEIRILAAAHLQRPRRSTENIPLSPESEARYRLKAGKFETETVY